jgi:hypothetical protein
VNIIDPSGTDFSDWVGGAAEDVYNTGKEAINTVSSISKRLRRPIQGCIVLGVVAGVATKSWQGAAVGCVVGAVLWSVRGRR